MGEHDFTHCQDATIKHTQVTRCKGSGDPAKITIPDKPQRGTTALEESQLHKPLHEQQQHLTVCHRMSCNNFREQHDLVGLLQVENILQSSHRFILKGSMCQPELRILFDKGILPDGAVNWTICCRKEHQKSCWL